METVTVVYDEKLADTGEGGAILFLMDDREIWIPNSLIMDECSNGIEIPLWFAEKEELV